MEAAREQNQRIIEIDSQYAQVGTRNRVSTLEWRRPTLRVEKTIRSPANLARARLHFPDEKSDHEVCLLVLKDANSHERIDFNFGDCGGSEGRRERYRIDVEVRRKDGCETEVDTPSSYLWERSKKTASPGFVRFWFRFFEPNAEYKITFSLKRPTAQRKLESTEKLHETTITVLTNSKSKPARKKSRDPPSCDSDGSEDDNDKPIVHFHPAPGALSERSLELTQTSNHVMKRLQRPRDNGRWEEFTEGSHELSAQYGHDLDTRLTIKLEESVMKCYLNRLDESKALIKTVLSQVAQAVNSRMLTGRAFHYLAGVYRREKSFGEAQKCIQLASQNIHGSGVSFDQSCLAYERASCLLEFCRCFPSSSPKLAKEVQHYLKKCIDSCTQLEEMAENGGPQLYVKKHHFAFIKIARLLLNCQNKTAREQDVVDEDIQTARASLQTVRAKYWSEMAEGEKVQFYLAQSDLEYRLQNYQAAETFAQKALEKAQMFSFNTEIRPAQERLAHIQHILQQLQLSDETGDELSDPVTSSASDGQTADVSSCTESDWLPFAPETQTPQG